MWTVSVKPHQMTYITKQNLAWTWLLYWKTFKVSEITADSDWRHFNRLHELT